MYSVYTTARMAKLGQAVVIVCNSKNGTSCFAEFHILFPHTRRRRIFRSLAIEIPDEMVVESVLSLARERLQAEADMANRQLFPHEPVAARVELLRVDDSVVRQQLWMGGLATQGLREVCSQTESPELREFLERVQRLPVVGTHPAAMVAA